jgi:hypothetical protein
VSSRFGKSSSSRSTSVACAFPRRAGRLHGLRSSSSSICFSPAPGTVAWLASSSTGLSSCGCPACMCPFERLRTMRAPRIAADSRGVCHDRRRRRRCPNTLPRASRLCAAAGGRSRPRVSTSRCARRPAHERRPGETPRHPRPAPRWLRPVPQKGEVLAPGLRASYHASNSRKPAPPEGASHPGARRPARRPAPP